MSQANRYTHLAALTQRVDTIDCAYHAAFYLLSTDRELFDTACKFVNIEGINFSGMKRATRNFDERTRHIIDIAHNLFSYNSSCKATPFEISRLGYPMMEQVCNALYIASGEVEVKIRDNENGKPSIELDTTRYQKTIQAHHFMEQLQAGMLADEHSQSEDNERGPCSKAVTA